MMFNKIFNGVICGLKIQFLFDDRNKIELEVCLNSFKNKRFRELYINCLFWNKGK